MNAVTEARREEERRADLAMLEAVQGGDLTAYRGLVEKYQGRVYAVVYGMLRNREDARDVTQDAFVRAYHNIGSFRVEASFYTWLYRIAMNLAIDLIRKRKRRDVAGFDDGIAQRGEDGEVAEAYHSDSPARLMERKQLYNRIMDAMDQLPADQKQVILLRELEGLSYKEISDVMEIPEGTVMSRLFYARKKLQKLLAEDGTP